jgi:hypothetical protein
MDALCEIKELSELNCSLITWGLYVTYVAFGIALIAAVVLPMISAANNPKSLVKSGIGVAVLLIVFAIGYAVSDGSLSAFAVSEGITENGSKMIGAGLITFYVALIGTSLGLIYSEVSKAIK